MAKLSNPTAAIASVNSDNTFSARLNVKFSGVSATGHYTIDGSTPSGSHGTSFTDVVVTGHLAPSVRIRVMSTKTGYTDSNVMSFTLAQLLSGNIRMPFSLDQPWNDDVILPAYDEDGEEKGDA